MKYKTKELAGRPLLIQSRKEIAALIADMKYSRRTKYTSALVQSVLAIFQKNGRWVNLFLAALEAEGLCTLSSHARKTQYFLSSKGLRQFLVDTERENMVRGCVKNAEKETTLHETYIYKSKNQAFEDPEKSVTPTHFNPDVMSSVGVQTTDHLNFSISSDDKVFKNVTFLNSNSKIVLDNSNIVLESHNLPKIWNFYIKENVVK